MTEEEELAVVKKSMEMFINFLETKPDRIAPGAFGKKPITVPVTYEFDRSNIVGAAVVNPDGTATFTITDQKFIDAMIRVVTQPGTFSLVIPPVIPAVEAKTFKSAEYCVNCKSWRSTTENEGVCLKQRIPFSNPSTYKKTYPDDFCNRFEPATPMDARVYLGTTAKGQ